MSSHRPVVIIARDPAVEGLLHMLVEEVACTFLGPPDGESQIAQVRAAEPALVLVDLFQPDDVEILRLLKADERTRDVPVVALVIPEEDTGRKALAAGAAACLPKPFAIDDLIKIVREYTAGHRGAAPGVEGVDGAA